MEREHLSLHEAARRFGIPDHKMVANMERHFSDEALLYHMEERTD